VRAARVCLGVALALLIGAIGSRRMDAHDRLSNVTWDRDIQPIVEARCLTCHATGQTAPALASYESARPWARAIRHQVLTRRMPVWRAARGYGEFANDPSLSPFEISLIVAWVDGGAPKAPATRGGVTAAPRSAIISPPTPLPVERGHDQTFACDGRGAPLTGVLLSLRPRLDAGGSIHVVVLRPDGARDVIGWFRDVEPGDPTIYSLRTPLTLPAGSRIAAEVSGSASCALTASLR
jgi:hypothetical protein